MGLSVDITFGVVSTGSELCQRVLGRPVIRAEKRGRNRVQGSLGGIDWYGVDYWYQLDICGQAEGNNDLPTITTIFEHYYLVRASLRIFQ